jgi:RNA polymerase sigma-70 factor (ECF subfamily)
MDGSVTIRLPGFGIPEQDAKNAASREAETILEVELSDEDVMAQICEGSREMLAVLFRRYARLVRGVANRVLRDVSEAEDLLQDIFILIHRLCGTFDSSKGPARFWILQMTYRRAIDRRRYLASRHFYTRVDLDQAEHQLGDTPTKSGNHGDSMEQALDRREVLHSWFNELSEDQQQTLDLFFFGGYTFDEIAAKLGQTVGNARNHYYRGLDMLRKQISAGRLPGKEAV